jgi:hypothetical protein
MIRYALKCEHEHGFEAWFSASTDYDDQAARGLVECPLCGSHMISKQIMSPAVAGAKKRETGPDLAQMQTLILQAAREARSHVEQNFDYVGDAFAREARDIHEGRSEKREIYGEATPAEVIKLREDGVPCAPLPPLPPDPAKAH